MSDGVLMGPEKARSLLKLALDHSCADQAEAGLFAGKWALTRFANSTIHQNMAGDNAVMRVRAVFGRKVAAATSNKIDEAGVRALVDDVVNMARLQDENPDFVSLPEPIPPEQMEETFYQETAQSAPERRGEMVESIVSESDKVNGTAAGSVFVRGYEHAVMNSLGIDSYYRGTASDLVTVVTGPEGGFGYASASGSDLRAIDARALGAKAASLAEQSRNPVAMDPGEYECILMPNAVADMVGMMAYMGFGALAYQENRSFMCGKLGQKIVGEDVNIWDNGLDPRTFVALYDGEGVAKQRVDLIKGGVANGLLYSSYTAHREGKKSTGHGGGGESEMAGSYLNLIMAHGSATVDNMIANTKRGLLVTRFHYTNVAHLMTATITGMTRDGTFLIENGRIVGPVKNMRFTQSILEALSNVDMIGRGLELHGGVLVPAIKVGKFRFSSATQF